MNARDGKANCTDAILILNASPDSGLLDLRARMLNEAGYYTSAARTIDEALRHATSMDCAAAVICYSFSHAERQLLSDRLHKLSPRTVILCLDPEADSQAEALISKVEAAMTQKIV